MITETFTQEEQAWLVENAERVRAMMKLAPLTEGYQARSGASEPTVPSGGSCAMVPEQPRRG